MAVLYRPTANIVLLHLPSFFVTRLGKTSGYFTPLYSLAFVHGYIGGVSLYFNDLVFSRGGGGARGKWGVWGMALRFICPSNERNEWGKDFNNQKKLFSCNISIVTWITEKPWTQARESKQFARPLL